MDSSKTKLVRAEKEKDRPQIETIIRSELNLEKWPAIWQPTKFKGKLEARIFKRGEVLPDNSKIQASVKVGFTDAGVLNTEDQKMLYSLIHLWEKQGKPDEIVFSIQQLVSILGKTWGKQERESAKQSLLRLRFTGFIWKNAYFNSCTKETISELGTFTILSELFVAEKESQGHSTKQLCRARFYPLVEANLRANHSLPTLFKVVVGFKSGIAQLIYKYLELKLYKHQSFERRTQELFDELGLNSEQYRYPSVRKQTLKSALPELQEIPIQDGILTVKLEATSDAKDYKLVAIKHQRTDQNLTSADFASLELLEIPVQNPLQPPSETDITDLVQHFYKCFSIKRSKPAAKELDRARDLMTSYRLSLDQAKQVVDFSLFATKETGFSVQNFGGIVQYAEAALAQLQPSVEVQTPVSTGVIHGQPEIVSPFIDLETSEERFWKIGEDLFYRQPPEAREKFIAEEKTKLLQSEKREIYVRWSDDVFTEHVCYQVKKKLAEDYLKALQRKKK